MELVTHSLIAHDHPCLSGHFPGNPIVPAVVILEAVTKALARWLPGREMAHLGHAKFIIPLRPEEEFSIAFAEDGEERFSFVLKKTQGDVTFAQGSFSVVGRSRGDLNAKRRQ